MTGREFAENWYVLAVAICAPGIVTMDDAWEAYTKGFVNHRNGEKCKEALRLRSIGWGLKQIAKNLGVKQETVSSYICIEKKRRRAT